MTAQINNAILPEVEDYGNNSVVGAFGGRIPLSQGSAVWDNPELSRETFRTIKINSGQLQRPLVTFPQSGGEFIAVCFYGDRDIAKYPLSLQQIFIPEIIKISGISQIEETTTEKDYRWVCSIAEKTTPHSRVSYLLPYAFSTEKQEYFSPDFHDIRDKVNSLFQSEFAKDSATSQAIEEAPTEKINEIITAECLGFCESLDLTNTLKDCLEQVKQDFKSAQKIQAELSYFHDDEADNEPHVTIEVKVNTSRETAESNYDKWLDWFIKDVSDSARKFFILTIDRV